MPPPARDQKQPWFLRQEHADLEPLLLAMRQAAGDAFAQRSEAHDLQDAVMRSSSALFGARTGSRAAPSLRSASRILSSTCASRTRSFLNLRPMPSSGNLGLVERVRSGAAKRHRGVGLGFR